MVSCWSSAGFTEAPIIWHHTPRARSISEAALPWRPPALRQNKGHLQTGESPGEGTLKGVRPRKATLGLPEAACCSISPSSLAQRQVGDLVHFSDACAFVLPSRTFSWSPLTIERPSRCAATRGLGATNLLNDSIMSIRLLSSICCGGRVTARSPTRRSSARAPIVFTHDAHLFRRPELLHRRGATPRTPIPVGASVPGWSSACTPPGLPKQEPDSPADLPERA